MAAMGAEEPTSNPPVAMLVVVAVVTAVVLRHLISSWRLKARLPPGPRSLPVIGHLHLLRPPVHRTFHELSSKTGPLMHIRLGSTHCVVAGTAEAASELIRGHEGSISERSVTAVARQFAYGSAGFAFAPYDAHWRFMKRLCMSELLGPRTVEQLRPIRRAGTVAMLRGAVAAAARGDAVDLTRELIRLSNTSIIRMVASTVPGSVADEAQQLVKEVAELVGAFNVDDYIAVCRGWDLQGLGRRAVAVHRRFDALLEDMLRHKEEAREKRRLLMSSTTVGDDKKENAVAAAEGLDPRGQHFQFMPFGSGRRGCPGMGLALQSVPAVLAALVQCFDWAVVTTGAGEEKKIDMSESDGLVCARMHPLVLRPTPRLNPFPAVV